MQIEAGKTGKARGISTYNNLDIADLRKVLDNEAEIALGTALCSKEAIPTKIKTISHQLITKVVKRIQSFLL